MTARSPGFRGVASRRGMVPNHVQRKAPALPVIDHALQDQGAAVCVAAGGDLLGSHPQGTQDAGVQGPRGIVPAEFPGEGETQVGDVAGRPWPLVHADQMGWPERPGGFLQRLPRASRHQGFALVEVPGRLVDADAVVGFLFDQEVTAFPLDEGGHRDVGLPDSIHDAILPPRPGRLRAIRQFG